MANSHRISWIDSQIRAGRYPNATTIAARFEISRRQAARDIEYLRYSMGAPITYSADHNGYHYTDDAYALPALVVSDPERAALVYLAERYASLDGEAAGRVAAVLRRVGAHAIDDGRDVAPVVPIESAELDAVTVLRRAIDARRKVVVRYRGADGGVVTRTIWPYAVISRFGGLSCLGYCEQLSSTHLFPIFRFERVEQTSAEFEVPAYMHAHEWERPSVPPQPFVAVVRLDDPADADRIETAVALDDGAYRIEFHDAQSVISSLLSCPSAFEVVSPLWLRNRVAARLEALLSRHHPSDVAAT